MLSNGIDYLLGKDRTEVENLLKRAQTENKSDTKLTSSDTSTMVCRLRSYAQHLIQRPQTSMIDKWKKKWVQLAETAVVLQYNLPFDLEGRRNVVEQLRLLEPISEDPAQGFRPVDTMQVCCILSQIHIPTHEY